MPYQHMWLSRYVCTCDQTESLTDAMQALLPVRIGVSLGAAPVFARWALEPIRHLGKRWIRRKQP